MNEKLAAIDESSIEELMTIKSEQDVILERLERIDERRESVSEEVFDRVRLDYRGRLQDLENKAEPLKSRARDEYAALLTVTEEIETIVKTADLDREELELRHEVGEFDDEVFEAHLQEHEAKFAGHQADLEQAVALKQRFLAAFRTEDELTPRSKSSKSKASDVEISLETLGGQAILAPDEESGPDSEADDSIAGEEETAVFEPDETVDDESDVNATTAPLVLEDNPQGRDRDQDPPAEPEDPPESATMILNWPTLIIQADGAERVEHSVVGGSTVIGGAAACDVVLAGTRVADRHAEIVMAPGGHVIRDLGAPVGTLVNGVEISEWRLEDGDMIQIGEVVLLFKEGGP